jgi:polyhydroxyalkanoate synthesis regulator phasin
MPENDLFKRYLDAGMAFTQMTRAKAEELVNQWVKAGEVQRDQAQARVDDIVDRSRKNSEQFFDTIRKEIANQLAALGLATKDDLGKLEARLSKTMETRGATSADTPGPKKAAPKKAAAKKAPVKKAPAKKAIAADLPPEPAEPPAQPEAAPEESP